jgi:hypothetical protein
MSLTNEIKNYKIHKDDNLTPIPKCTVAVPWPADYYLGLQDMFLYYQSKHVRASPSRATKAGLTVGLSELHRSIFSPVALKGIIRGNEKNFRKNYITTCLIATFLDINMVS